MSFYTHHHGFSLLNLNTQKMSFFYLFFCLSIASSSTYTFIIIIHLFVNILFLLRFTFFMIKADISMTAIYFFVAYVSFLVRNVFGVSSNVEVEDVCLCIALGVEFLLCPSFQHTQILNQLISCQIKEKLRRKWVEEQLEGGNTN